MRCIRVDGDRQESVVTGSRPVRNQPQSKSVSKANVMLRASVRSFEAVLPTRHSVFGNSVRGICQNKRVNGLQHQKGHGGAQKIVDRHRGLVFHEYVQNEWVQLHPERRMKGLHLLCRTCERSARATEAREAEIRFEKSVIPACDFV